MGNNRFAGEKFHHTVFKSASKLTAHADIFRFTFKKQLCHYLFPVLANITCSLPKKKVLDGWVFMV